MPKSRRLDRITTGSGRSLANRLCLLILHSLAVTGLFVSNVETQQKLCSRPCTGLNNHIFSWKATPYLRVATPISEYQEENGLPDFETVDQLVTYCRNVTHRYDSQARMRWKWQWITIRLWTASVLNAHTFWYQRSWKRFLKQVEFLNFQSVFETFFIDSAPTFVNKISSLPVKHGDFVVELFGQRRYTLHDPTCRDQ